MESKLVPPEEWTKPKRKKQKAADALLPVSAPPVEDDGLAEPDAEAWIEKARAAPPARFDRQQRINRLCILVADCDASLSALMRAFMHNAKARDNVIEMRLDLSEKLAGWLREIDPDDAIPLPDVFQGIDNLLRHWQPPGGDKGE